MKLAVVWTRPIALTPDKEKQTAYTCDLKQVPELPGVYIFGRRHGSKFDALYVGKAGDVRKRVTSQLNNHRLMVHLSGAKNGQREVIAGTFNAKKGQRVDRCLPIIERALIRYFLLEGQKLINIQGTKLWEHELLFSGLISPVPDLMLASK